MCLPLQEISDAFRHHLISWQHLACQSELRGLRLFKCRPKHHSLDHLTASILKNRINPRKTMQCFSDESFLGYLKHITIRCHGSSAMRRTFHRYLLFLSFRWRDANSQWQTRGWSEVWREKNLGCPTRVSKRPSQAPWATSAADLWFNQWYGNVGFCFYGYY